MSRGPGAVERAVIESLQHMARPTTSQLAANAYGVSEATLTGIQLGTVRRVLRRLKARGVVRDEVQPAVSRWHLQGRHARAQTVPPPQGDAAVPIPFAGSTQTLAARRVPVSRRRARGPC
jgi:hypothetical protein